MDDMSEEQFLNMLFNGLTSAARIVNFMMATLLEKGVITGEDLLEFERPGSTKMDDYSLELTKIHMAADAEDRAAGRLVNDEGLDG